MHHALQTLQGKSDVLRRHVTKYDAAGGSRHSARGLLFTSSRNIGSAAGEEGGRWNIVKQLSWIELRCSAFGGGEKTP